MRPLFFVPAITLAMAVLAGPAAAEVNELGASREVPLVQPSCAPTVKSSDCTIILTQVTALETIRGTQTYPTKITKDGEIVAFTIGLSNLDPNRKKALSDIKYLDKAYGGTTQAGITVVLPVGKHKKFTWKMVSQSPVFHLQPYLGQVVQFPLQTPLQVTKGEEVALTVPTWAPVLSINLPKTQAAYRQSRDDSCTSTPASSAAAQTPGVVSHYGCNYPGTRVEYSVTEVTSPTPTPHYVH